jgi:hypothetical protein
MPKTYEPIATNTLGSATANVTFSSISSAYTDLVIIIANNTGATTSSFTFNSDSSALYSRTVVRGDGSTSASSFRQSGLSNLPVDGSVSGPFQNAIIHINNYSNATTFKTVLIRSNNAGAGLDQAVGLYRSTSAISTINFNNGSNFGIGTTFTLYGIKAA